MTASTFFPGIISTPAEPAIPIVYEDSATDEKSLRIHAAIQLRVPNSGIPWLDRMIRESRRLDAKARGAAPSGITHDD
ncbi:MAG TPA: hypothetical protein VN737_00045 [Bryobacteraceae bacterium]|jgi:hypothetical protein|nr:hypothetical protein [Bryobacteraceae bacterium]